MIQNEINELQLKVQVISKDIAKARASLEAIIASKDEIQRLIALKQCKLERLLLNNQNTKLEVGSVINVGAYQNIPIYWTVLKLEGDCALIITNQIIATMCYDEKVHSYEKSKIRSFLINDLYNGAFSPMEKSMICIKDIAVDFEPKKKNGSITLTDPIFLLSYDEVNDLFPKNEQRRVGGTAHAMSTGLAYSKDSKTNEQYASWWLRTGYLYDDLAYVVYGDGSIHMSAVRSSTRGIRPLMWIKMK